MIYQDANFKIRLSLFGWKENILPEEHIVQCEHRELNIAELLISLRAHLMLMKILVTVMMVKKIQYLIKIHRTGGG